MRAGPDKAIQLAFYSSLRDNRVIFVVIGGVGLKEKDKVYFRQEKICHPENTPRKTSSLIALYARRR